MAEHQINRRRFIQIFAAATAMPLAAFSDDNKSMIHWDGVSLGADSSIKLFHPNKDKAKRILKACLQEIQRLESIFSLYKDNSIISQLNREGFIDNPPIEFVELVQAAKYYGDITDGVFDITVQPLWNYKGEVKDIVPFIDYKKINVHQDRVSFDKTGMQITLNGIAQGYITDKITALLRGEGVGNALVELGEKYAIGKHPSGRKWKVGIEGAENIVLSLENNAISTSSNNASEHIYNPLTGFEPKKNGVTVVADNATKADALSTAICIMPNPDIAKILGKVHGVSSIYQHA